MPWNNKDVIDMRIEAIELALRNEKSVAEICRQFNISRQTFYKWKKRFESGGLDALLDKGKAPHKQPNRVPSEITKIILEERKKYPSWGAKKLHQVLMNQGYCDLPSISSFNRILKRHNMITLEKSQKAEKFIRFERDNPMELLQMDFKGHFPIKNGRCHPLTVLDDHSRYCLCLKACLGETRENVQSSLTEMFREYGLPLQMTMDNGPPWKGAYPFRLSRFTIWLMRLGIKVSHSRPRHPQTQGKDERFHRTIKEELLKYQNFTSIEEAQDCFDEWLPLYNEVRPHEGIQMKRPIDLFKASDRVFPEKLPRIEYLDDDEVRKVAHCGCISYGNQKYYLGEYLIGEYVALRKSTTEANRLNIYYINTILQSITI